MGTIGISVTLREYVPILMGIEIKDGCEPPCWCRGPL